jgi:hypothetical protein
MGGKIKDVLLESVPESKVGLAENHLVVFTLRLSNYFSGRRHNGGSSEQVETIFFTCLTSRCDPNTVLVRCG